MYRPPHFAETRIDVLHALMRNFSLATLVTMRPGGLEADHIPLLLETGENTLGTLRGHVARGNPLWRECAG